MKQEFLKNFPHIGFTLAALIIFLILFIGLVLRVTASRNRAIQTALSQLPLEEDDKGGNHVG